MYKSRKKMIGVITISSLTLVGFALGSWAIIDSTMPKKQEVSKVLAQKLVGLTEYLGEENVFNIRETSIYNWINYNMPSKVLIEKTSENSEDIYIYTNPNSILKEEFKITDFNSFNDYDKLKAINNHQVTNLVVKIESSWTSDSTSYKFFIKDVSAADKYFEYAKYTMLYDETKVKGISISYSPQIKQAKNGYNKTFDAYGETEINESKLSFKLEENKLTSEIKKENNQNVSTSYFKSESIADAKTQSLELKRYSTTSDTDPLTTRLTKPSTQQAKEDSNYVIYNVGHSKGGTNYTEANKNNYQSLWKVDYFVSPEIDFVGMWKK